ncbi:hypothetical protein P7C70_g4970, partial [Phenoliferia sp. Uapishka_3]
MDATQANSERQSEVVDDSKPPILLATHPLLKLIPSSLSSFSRDLSRLDPDAKDSGSDDSSEESSSEEEDTTDPSSRLGQLPPVAGSDSEGEEVSSGLAKNLNSQLSMAPAVGPDGEPAEPTVRRTGEKLTPEQVAEARKARKAQGKGKPTGAKGSGSESEDEENENMKAKKNLKMADLNAPREMSRREKEQADKAAAKERYAKLHAAGKTDEAKSDLGRLAEIRKQREVAAARRKAETDAKDEAAKVALDKSGKKVPEIRKPGAGRRTK